MSFRPSMTSFTSRIRPVSPLTTRSWQGATLDLWSVDIAAGARGRYVARDPRFVVVLDPLQTPMALDCEDGSGANAVSVAYIPAGVSAQSRFASAGPLQHLDLHFDKQRLVRSIADLASYAPELLARPFLISGTNTAHGIALLIARELASGEASEIVLQSLSTAFIHKVLDSAGASMSPRPQRGGLTRSQLQKVSALMQDRMHGALSVADMAEHVGLSESWFAHAYRQGCGASPYRALQALRVRTAQALLQQGEAIADTAVAVGFADQAHLTRAFRSHVGQTPGAWRKSMLSEQECAIPDSFSQDWPGHAL
ncbi:helix-turn-helix domain-containing protein [Roseovarius sp. S1116L3]|uniref:helix-turn-helix domain-containing protein n=1 Tax=Roseovarius roseus TaxID=3342636 RepID=UPI0037287763